MAAAILQHPAGNPLVRVLDPLIGYAQVRDAMRRSPFGSHGVPTFHAQGARQACVVHIVKVGVIGDDDVALIDVDRPDEDVAVPQPLGRLRFIPLTKTIPHIDNVFEFDRPPHVILLAALRGLTQTQLAPAVAAAIIDAYEHLRANDYAAARQAVKKVAHHLAGSADKMAWLELLADLEAPGKVAHPLDPVDGSNLRLLQILVATCWPEPAQHPQNPVPE